MTTRPRRGGATSGPAYPNVPIPADVLDRARREPGSIAAADVVEDYLREIHGPPPDHRADRPRWLAWVAAVEERALGLLEDGTLT